MANRNDEDYRGKSIIEAVALEIQKDGDEPSLMTLRLMKLVSDIVVPGEILMEEADWRAYHRKHIDMSI